MTDDYEPVIRWTTHEEVCVKQEIYAVRERRPSHPDPTADEAIGQIISEAKREKRKQHNRKPFRRPRIGVWRWDDEQRKNEQHRDERRKQDGR